MNSTEKLFFKLSLEKELRDMKKEAEKQEKALSQAKFQFEFLQRKIHMYEMAIEELINEE